MSRCKSPTNKSVRRAMSRGNEGRRQKARWAYSHRKQNRYSSSRHHRCSRGCIPHTHRHRQDRLRSTDRFPLSSQERWVGTVARMGRTLDRSHHSSHHHRRAGTGPRHTRSRWGKRLGRARRMAERRRSRRHRFDPVGSQPRRCTARSTRRSSKVR